MEKLTLQLNHIPDNWQALLQYLASLNFVDAIEFRGKVVAKKTQPNGKPAAANSAGFDLEKVLKEKNMTRQEWDEIQAIIAKGVEKSSFGDALEWQKREREDRFLPFSER